MKTLARAAQINAADVGDLQTALDHLPPDGGCIYLPAGCYEIDHTVTCRLGDGQHLYLHGDGRATVIRFTATDGSPLLALDGVPDSWWPDLRLTIRDLSLVGNEHCGDALYLRWPNDALIDTCFFYGFGGTAITVTPQATNVTIRDCWMRDCRSALHADNLHHLTFHGNQTRSRDGGLVQREHLYIGKHCREVRIVDNHLAYGHAEAIILEGTAQHVIANNTIEGFSIGIRVIDSRDILINANYLHCPIGVQLEGDNRGIAVSGNLLTENRQGALVSRETQGSGGHVVTGNVIRQSVYDGGQRGLDLGQAVDCVVANNMIEDAAAGSALVGAGDRGSAIAGNVITDSLGRLALGELMPTAPLPPDHPWRALYERLDATPATAPRVILTFGDIEGKLKLSLPPAARQDRLWWTNTVPSDVPPTALPALAWLAAGWVVTEVRRIEGRVVFMRRPVADGLRCRGRTAP